MGDARRLVREIKEPVALLFIDCDYSNYLPCLAGIEDRLADGAIVVADNAGLGAAGMRDYLDHVRTRHRSKTEWFDIDLPRGKRDAMEVTTNEKKVTDETVFEAGTSSDQMVCLTDLVATCAEIVGAELPATVRRTA